MQLTIISIIGSNNPPARGVLRSPKVTIVQDGTIQECEHEENMSAQPLASYQNLGL